VRQRWYEKFSRYPEDSDVSRIYSNFIPKQLACLRNHSTLITGKHPTYVHTCSKHNAYIMNHSSGLYNRDRPGNLQNNLI